MTQTQAAKGNTVAPTFYRPGYLYFSFFVWLSCTGGRFLAPFLEHQGGNMTAERIGFTLGMQAVISMACSSAGGSWADARERVRPGVGRIQVMATGIGLGGTCCLLHAASYVCNWPLFSSYYWHGGLQFVYAAASVLTIPVLDGVTIQFLQDHADFTKQDYGKERLYGAVGWAVIHMVMAPLLDWIGFIVVYPLALLSTLVALVTLYQYVYWNSGSGGCGDAAFSGQDVPVLKHHASDLGSSSQREPKNNNNNHNGLVGDSAPRVPLSTICRLLIGTVYGATFLFAMLTLAQGQAVVDSLVFIFFEYLGSSYTVMGMTVLLTVSFEIPIFKVAPRLLERFGSGTLLLVASVCYIIRAVGYSCIPVGHILYVLALEPLHGVTYACSQTASVDIAAKSMPVGYEATGQSFMYVTRGLGSCLGLWWGGKAMDTIGPRIMYRVSACVAFVGCSTFAWVVLSCPAPVSEPNSRRELVLVPTEEDTDESMGMDPSSLESEELSSLPVESSLELQELGSKADLGR